MNSFVGSSIYLNHERHKLSKENKSTVKSKSKYYIIIKYCHYILCEGTYEENYNMDNISDVKCESNNSAIHIKYYYRA